MSVARRTARALALLALAWAALLAGAAQAQTPTTLVSNTEGTQGTSTGAFQAQSFTTGPNPTGYALSDVQLKLHSASSTSATVNVVKIFSNSSSSEPDTVFVTLRNPTALTAGALNTFTAPDGVTLNPNTTYWVVVNDGVTTDPITIYNYNTDFNDGNTAQTGWNIADFRLQRTSATDSWTTRGLPIQIAVRGSVNEAPPPLVSNTGQTATSTGSNFRQAQPFTTGPNPAGYALSDVQVMLHSASATSATGSVVRIFSHDSVNNLPGIGLFVLGNPETLTAGGLNTFTAPDYVTLSPNTDYWVVINDGVTTNPITISRTLSAAEGTAEEGWSIGNSRLYYSQGAWDTGPDPILLAIRGVANEGPPTLVANTAQTASAVGSNVHLAQAFVTGSNPTGYALSDVRLVLDGASSTSATGSVVKIFSNHFSTDQPQVELVALGNPATLTAGALNTFTAPEGFTLRPNTVYWVVINDGAADPISVSHTSSTVEETAEESWSIGNSRLYYSQGAWVTRSDPILLAIRGSANEVPPPFESYANDDGDEVLWAATMTVGVQGISEGLNELVNTGYLLFRFFIAGQEGPPYGSISSSLHFIYDGTSYFVTGLTQSAGIYDSVTLAEWLFLKLSPQLPQALVDKLALDLDGVEYRLDEAILLGEEVQWHSSLPPTWTAGQTVSAQLVVRPPRPPGPPGNFAASGGDGSATLSWDAPIDGGSHPLTGFEYRYATGGRPPDSEWLDVPDSNIGEANRNSYTIGTLTNDLLHTFELRAVSAAGDGEAVRARVTPRGSSVQHGGTTTVLSNLGQTTEADSLVMDADITYTRDANGDVTAVRITKMGYGYAQTFSTGSDGHLFKPDYVDIKFATAGSGDGGVNGDVILAALWEWDAAARAVTRFVGQFERKQAADGETRFAYHHRGENLQASTTYAIVIDAKDIENTTATLAQTASDVEDVNRSGWNLDGFSYQKPFNRSAKEAWTKLDNALQVKINVRQGSAAGGLYIHDAEVYEAHGATLDFKVTLDPAPGANVTVEYRTLDSSIGYCSGSFFDDAAGQCRTTARTPADYAYTEGTLTFASGETLKTIEVPVVDDRIEDSGEGVEMILLNPSGSFLSRDAAIGIIYNDEEAALPSEVTINSPSATEGAGATLDFVVSLSEATTATVTLDYATSDATAVAQSDYEAKSGTIELPAGATSATISVALVDDAEAEGDETLTLTLSNLERAVFAAGADSLSATGTIEDNDESTAGTPVPGDSTTTGTNEQHDRPHALQATATEEAVVLTWQDPDTHPSNNLYHILRHRPELGEAEPEVYAEYASITDRTFADSAVTAGVLYGYAVRAVKDALGYLGPMSEIVKVRMPADTTDSATEDGEEEEEEEEEEAPLTATFRNVPEEHDGETTFFFQVLFSEEIPTSYTVLRDDGAFEVTGGAVRKARRVDGRDDLREIHIEPSGGGDVFVLLPETTDCDAAGAICMGGDDGRKLSTADSARVAGPAGGSVSGRMEQEGSAAMATASEDEEELPDEVMLTGNYPNPFNPRTTIRYALPQAGTVRLVVYDMLGREVAVLADGPKPAGRHAARFDAGGLPSGTYVYRLQAQDRIIVRTMMLVK